MLSGVRVLDFSMNAAGPSGTALLAAYGATVIKVERPSTGDDGRSFGPFVDGISVAFEALNSGKQSIAVDLSDPEGVALIRRLIPGVQVVVESFRPGVMEKLGLGYEALRALKPDLIYASVSAFGQRGAYATRPGYDVIAQAVSGVMSVTGSPQEAAGMVGFALGDMVGALNLYACVVSALYHHKNTGEGQAIDVSLVQGLIWMNGSLNMYNTGAEARRAGNHNASLSPYGLHEGRGGQSLVIAAVNKKTWESLCGVIGQPELKTDPRFSALSGRVENRPQLTAIIEGWLKTFEDIGQAAALLLQAGVPSTKVYLNSEVCTDEVFRSLGWFVERSLPGLTSRESLLLRGMNASFSKTPGALRPAPALGRDTHDVMASCGYGEEDIRRLSEKWGQV